MALRDFSLKSRETARPYLSLVSRETVRDSATLICLLCICCISFKDYDDFDIANEDDTLEEFLGLPKKDPPVDPNAPPKEGEPGKPDQPAVNGEEPMSVDKA